MAKLTARPGLWLPAVLCLAATASFGQTATPAAAPSAGGGVSAASATPAPTVGLAQSYRLALENDAVLRTARAAADSRRERLPQARAQLLPNVSASVTRYRNSLDTEANTVLGPSSSHQNYTSNSRVLSLRQPLYRPYQWADYKQAQLVVQEANANLEKEVQNLAMRVALGYLEALRADDQLALVLAQRRAFEVQLEAARRRFSGGQGTRTDVDQAQAQVDLAVAQELEARQNIGYARQQLQALIGAPVGGVRPIDEQRLQLLPPNPDRLDEWIARAEATSPELLAARAQVDEAALEVEKARAGHKPTLDAIVQYSHSDSETVSSVNQSNKLKSAGVQLSVPLFAGGYVNSQVRQALAEQQRVQEALESLRRDLGLRIHKEYRGVSEGVLRVRALEQAVRSAGVAVESSRRSYQAGARTVVDVLSAESQYANALRELLDARYTYLLSRVRLRALAGEADMALIQEADGWLKP